MFSFHRAHTVKPRGDVMMAMSTYNLSERHSWAVQTHLLMQLDTSSVTFLESLAVSTSYTLIQVTQPGLIRPQLVPRCATTAATAHWFSSWATAILRLSLDASWKCFSTLHFIYSQTYPVVENTKNSFQDVVWTRPYLIYSLVPVSCEFGHFKSDFSSTCRRWMCRFFS